jgi:cation transport ATPase
MSPRSKQFNKRVKIIYVVIFLWLAFGSLAAWFGTPWDQTSWYFASLTTYVGTYIISESIKKSETPTYVIPKSNREIIIYTCVAMWSAAGVYGILSKTELTQLAAYFTALSGFIAIYVLGQHLRASNEDSPSALNSKKSSKQPDVVKTDEPIKDPSNDSL